MTLGLLSLPTTLVPLVKPDPLNRCWLFRS